MADSVSTGASGRARIVLVAAVVAMVAAGTVLVAPAGAATLGCGDVITEDTTLTVDVGPCAGTEIGTVRDEVLACRRGQGS